jgi:hypothetical protein
MIGMAMEDLPEAQRRALEKELLEEMAKVRRRKLTCFHETHKGDQENRPSHHDYGNCYINGNS